MSKSVLRIVIAVLISLVLIVAIAPSVQARLGGILQKSEKNSAVYISVDNQALEQGSMKGLDSYFFDDGAGGGHDCGSSDPTIDY